MKSATTYHRLRSAYPEFIYERVETVIKDHQLELTFYFQIPPDHTFHPTVTIPLPATYNLSETDIALLAFHIGMVEMISYWKSTCSPQITINAGFLTNKQLSFWQTVFFEGLGEFWYLNAIETTTPESFVHFNVVATPDVTTIHTKPNTSQTALVLIGGGKDSIVSLELLKKTNTASVGLIINPEQFVSSSATAQVAGLKKNQLLQVTRKLDPRLLQLNDQGFLNGHTPFSAVLHFIALLVASLYGYQYIITSNESSANESTIPGTAINHQYSKSFAFESAFAKYTAELNSPTTAFSLLRPFNELQIAKIFSKFPQYFPIFISCNRTKTLATETEKWCGKCPKCLFVYCILSAFIPPSTLVTIFQKNLFEDVSLKPYLEQLIGLAPTKPFECVGTTTETIAALRLALEQYPNSPNDLPPLLAFVATAGILIDHNRATAVLNQWNPEHLVPQEYTSLLKSYVQ